MAGLADAIKRGTDPLLKRIKALANRTTIRRVDDSGISQAIQITALAGERLGQVVRLQNFGLTANPPAGSTALLISLGGSRTHCVVLGADHSSRPRDLLQGESQLYNQFGDYVHLQASGETLVRGRSKVIVDAPLMQAVGDVEIAGNLVVQGTASIVGDVDIAGGLHVDGAIASETSVSDPAGDMAEMRGVFNAHEHIKGGGASTDPPSALMT